MNWQERITLDPLILTGKPIIKGTRLAVDFLLGLLAQGWTEAQVLDQYPGLTHDDLIACIGYAQERIADERIYPRRVS